MTGEQEPPTQDPLRSAFQTQHPKIADEIEGAINTLRKLKQIANPDSKAALVGDEGEVSPATIAMTIAVERSPARSAAESTQALARTQADAPASDENPVLQASTAFGRYQIVRLLGRGAMGAVYLAYDTDLHRHVAIKTPFLGKSSQTIQRFQREARAAAQLRSPYLCPLYDVGKVGDVHYLSMAFIDGHPLSKVMADGGLKTIGSIVTIISRIAQGLQKAHEIGIVHRDLKPDNIMIDKDGTPIVLDFGLARKVNEDVQVTMAGVIIGTPSFMSPEQIDGDPAKVGPASDVYSLGIVFYHMLTGRLPFKGSLTSILNQIGTKVPPKPSTINLDIGADSPLEQVCMKMVAKSPGDRFASMAEVVAALEALSAKDKEVLITHTSTLDRLKTWSTGIISGFVRGKTPSNSGSATATETAVDPDAPTMIEPR